MPIIDRTGFMTLPPDAFMNHFASDLPAAESRVLAATQVPIRVDMLNSKVTNVAWKTKPSWYIVTTLDGALAPDEQRFFARRMKATTSELSASHLPMLSKPSEVVAVIKAAAAKSPH